MAVEEIRENVASLLDGASVLHRRKHYGSSIHLAIAASEETSKAILRFCQEHLPKNVYASRSRHLSKHRLAAAPNYILGQLQVAYWIKKAGDAGLLGGSKGDQATVVGDLIQHVGWRDPVSLATTIIRLISNEPDERLERTYSKAAVLREQDRVESIYVEVNGIGAVRSQPSKYCVEVSRDYLDQAKLGLQVLDFLLAPTPPNLENFVGALPRGLRSEYRLKAAALVDGVKAKKRSRMVAPINRSTKKNDSG